MPGAKKGQKTAVAGRPPVIVPGKPAPPSQGQGAVQPPPVPARPAAEQAGLPTGQAGRPVSPLPVIPAGKWFTPPRPPGWIAPSRPGAVNAGQAAPPAPPPAAPPVYFAPPRPGTQPVKPTLPDLGAFIRQLFPPPRPSGEQTVQAGKWYKTGQSDGLPTDPISQAVTGAVDVWKAVNNPVGEFLARNPEYRDYAIGKIGEAIARVESPKREYTPPDVAITRQQPVGKGGSPSSLTALPTGQASLGATRKYAGWTISGVVKNDDGSEDYVLTSPTGEQVREPKVRIEPVNFLDRLVRWPKEIGGLILEASDFPGDMAEKVGASIADNLTGGGLVTRTVVLPDGRTFTPEGYVPRERPDAAYGGSYNPTVGARATVWEAATELWGDRPEVKAAFEQTQKIAYSGGEARLKAMARILAGESYDSAMFGDANIIENSLLDKGWAEDPLKAILADPRTRYWYESRKAADPDVSDEDLINQLMVQGLPGEQNIALEFIGKVIFDPLNLIGGWGDDAVRAAREAKALKTFSNTTETFDEVLQAYQREFRPVVQMFGRAVKVPEWLPFVRTPTAVADEVSHTVGNALNIAMKASDEVKGSRLKVLQAVADAAEPAPLRSAFPDDLSFESALKGWESRQVLANKVLDTLPAGHSRAMKLAGLVLREMTSDKTGKLTGEAIREIVESGDSFYGKVERLVDMHRRTIETLLLPERKGAKTLDEWLALGERAEDYPIFERGIAGAAERVALEAVSEGKYVADFGDRFAAGLSDFMKGVNTALWNVFAKFSMAYSARNFQNNLLTVTVDGDFATWSGDVDDFLRNVVYSPVEAQAGIGAGGGVVETAKPTGSFWRDLWGQGFSGDLHLFGLPVGAQAVERAFSKRIVAAAARNYLERALRFGKGIPEIPAALARALGGEVVRGLAQRIQRTYGDVQEAVRWLREQRGSVEVWRILDEDDYAALQAVNPELAARVGDLLKSAPSGDAEALRRAFSRLTAEFTEAVKQAEAKIPTVLDEATPEYTTLAKDGALVTRLSEDGFATETAEQLMDFEAVVKRNAERRMRAEAAALEYIQSHPGDEAYKTFFETQRRLRDLAAETAEAVAKLREKTWARYEEYKALRGRIGGASLAHLIDELWTEYFEFRNRAWSQYTVDFEQAWLDWRIGAGEFNLTLSNGTPIRPDEFRGLVELIDPSDMNAHDKAVWAKMEAWVRAEDEWRAMMEAENAVEARGAFAVKRSELDKFFEFRDGVVKPKGFRAAEDRQAAYMGGPTLTPGGGETWREAVVEFLQGRGVNVADDAGEADLVRLAERIYNSISEAKKAVRVRPRPAGAAQLALKPESIPGARPRAGGAPPASGQAQMSLFGQHDPRGAPAILKRIEEKAIGRFGQVALFGLDEAMSRLLDDWVSLADLRAKETRLIAGRVGVEARNFALLNYSDRYNIDSWLSAVFPYHYWYTRTYANWLQRFINRPGLLAAYAKYKRALEDMHANLPEYWRNQLSTDDLGLPLDTPLMFNLEQTISPLYGLMGVDYTDPERRRAQIFGQNVGGLYETVGSYGPSVWAPIAWAIAIANAQSDPEAASAMVDSYLGQYFRWFRYGTAALKEATGTPLIPAGGINLDPQLALAAWVGGRDPTVSNMTDSERAKVMAALMAQLQSPPPGVDPLDWQAQVQDAMRLQQGPLWDRAMQTYFAGNFVSVSIASTFGLGYRARPQDQAIIAQIQQEEAKLREKYGTWTPEQIAEARIELRQRYGPMYDVVLYGRGGSAGDNAYVWDAVGRVGIGNYEMWEAAGVSRETLEAFFELKDTAALTPEQRDELLQAASAVNAVMRPRTAEEAKAQLAARQRYVELMEALAAEYGAETVELANRYAEMARTDKDEADAMLAALPEATRERLYDYWNSKTAALSSDLQTAAYYVDVARQERYYISTFYDRWEETGLIELSRTYGELKDMGEHKAAARLLNDNPELREYWNAKDAFYEVELPRLLNDWLKSLPETRQFDMREDREPVTKAQQDVAEYARSQIEARRPRPTSAPSSPSGSGQADPNYWIKLVDAEAEAAAEKQTYINKENKAKLIENWLGPLVAAYGAGAKSYFNQPRADKWLPATGGEASLEAYVGEARSIREAIMQDDGLGWTRIVAWLMSLSPEALGKLARSDPRYADAVVVAEQARRYPQPTLAAMFDILGITVKVYEDGEVYISRKQNLDKGGGLSVPVHPSIYARETGDTTYRRARRWRGRRGGWGDDEEGEAVEQAAGDDGSLMTWQNFAQAFDGNPLLILLMDYFDQSPYYRQSFLLRHPELAALVERLRDSLGALEQGYLAWRARQGGPGFAPGGRHRGGGGLTIQRFYPRRSGRSGLPQ